MTLAANRKGRVQLQLLGGFRLDVDGERTDVPASAQRLIAFLALRGPSERHSVAGHMWADAEEAHALGCLRTTVWRANRCVPRLVRAQRSVVGLADFVHIDTADCLEAASNDFGSAVRFLSSDSRGEDELAQPTIRRMIAELLPGWYDDWVLYERERLRQAHLHALEAASRDSILAGDHAMALDMALDIVRDEPLRETGHRLVIRVHLAEGNYAEALAAFDRFRSLLRRELGIEPSAEFFALGAPLGRASPVVREVMQVETPA